MAGKTRVGIKFQIDPTKLNALVKKIADVEKKAARKGVRQGVNQVSKLVLTEAKKLVPRRTGQLRKSLGRKIKSMKGGAVVYAVVKPRSGVWVKSAPGVVGRAGKGKRAGKTFVNKWRVEIGGKMVNPIKYAHLVEFGRREVVPKKKKVLADKVGKVIYGRRVRSVAPQPFLRPAWERYRVQAPGIIGAFVRRAIAEFWKKSRGG